MSPSDDQRRAYSVRQPRWGSLDKTSIVSRVKFEQLPDEVSLIAAPTDAERQGREIFERAAAGEFGEVAPFEPPKRRLSVPAAAIEAVRALSPSASGKALADQIAGGADGSPEDVSRGIVAYAQAVLADRLASLLSSAGKPKGEYEAMSVGEKARLARAAKLISAKEAVALNLMEDIGREILNGEARSFNTEYIRLYVNSLHACLAEYMTYNITNSVDDDWIDLIFLDSYTLIGESLARRAHPHLLGRLVD